MIDDGRIEGAYPELVELVSDVQLKMAKATEAFCIQKMIDLNIDPDVVRLQALEIQRLRGLIQEREWIPVSVRMPNVETNVYICAKRKLRGGECRYIYTVAMYEDGTVLENDSTWNWEELDGEWNETEECYIIPEGWWESTQYHPEGVLNSPVSDEVIAWMPLPEAYKGE